ncbi:hypothetical protein HELRODRAFT_170298 [Helobdella robusta]|uniref:PDZ domain-containing protein n=1 Tax=Helobdella robusta TaxID=6412 RepID=T1F2W3_HELRO|nr:hypothetical protein HELRODRAFT_170298 [Helobdella robusta]ESO07750.1 hypothetical protein HELRODRAFT_170298 [Helobdella robusta]
MPVIINLSKSDSSVPWGFRLYGGKDFGSPLTVQRINPGSIAAKCGLEIGDNISSIDSVSTTGLKHKEAQDLIVKAGNNIQLTICRGDEIPVRPADQTVVIEQTTVG